jgi:hypothetical protein
MMMYYCVNTGKELQMIIPGKIPSESVTDNYGRTAVFTECGDQT